MKRKLAEEINQQHIALLTRQLKSNPQDAELRENLTNAISECYSVEGSACSLHPVFQPQKFLNILPAILKDAGYHCQKVEWPHLTDELLEVGRKAIEDALVEWRDSRLAEIRNNGLVIKEKDGKDSSIIRFGPEAALRIGIEAMRKFQPAQEGK